MTLGRREYSEAEMMRMQRDAEERVREMQNRARQTVELENPPPPPSRNRNWSSGMSGRRPNRQPPPEPQRQANPEPQHQPPPTPEPPLQTPDPTESSEPKKATTIVEDIMGALKLDEDYLLVIGLLLILINQRADTTLILALAYLLI